MVIMQRIVLLPNEIENLRLKVYCKLFELILVIERKDQYIFNIPRLVKSKL